MADDSAWDVFLVQTRELKRYSIAAAVVILYYDYILTVVTEYNLYWVKSRLSWTSFLFFLNRYAALVAHIPAIIQSFWEISDDWFSQIYCTLAIAVVTTLLSIRTHALYGRSRTLLCGLVVLNLCGVSVSCWAIVTSRFLPGASAGNVQICNLPLTHEQGKYDAIAWIPSITFDCLIFGLTLYKRVQIGRTIRNSLFSLMIRDGTMYFGFLLVLYILDIVNSLVLKDRIGMPALTNAMSSTLISRLMLNIRDPKHNGVDLSSPEHSSVTFGQPRLVSLLPVSHRSSVSTRS